MNVRISRREIGENTPAFVIAEGGINHNGSIKQAKKLVAAASESGAEAIKFQTFKAEDLVSKNSKYFKIFKNLELSDEQFGELSDYSKSRGITFLSTPFSNHAIDVLNKIKVPAFKIASGDLTDLPLIKYAATKRKPMILSTGLADIKDVKDAIGAVKSKGNNKIILLHSVSSYPYPVEDANLLAIQTLKKEFSYPIGFSDNGLSLLVPLIAVALGASVVEKHFTINKKLKGPDHLLSADPFEMKKLIENIRAIETMFGNGIKKCQASERDNLINVRRSITVKKNIKKGERISSSMISLKRPATGIEPKYLYKIIGKKAKRNLFIDNTIKWNDIR